MTANDHIRLAVRGLRDDLRKLTDPISATRKSGTYFVEIGRYCGKSVQTPKVYIRMSDEQPDEQYQGSGPRSYRPIIELDIRVRDQTKGTVNSVEYTGHELQLAIFDLVSNRIDLNNKELQVSDGGTDRTAYNFIWRLSAGKSRYDEKSETWTMKPTYMCHKHKPT